MINKIPPPPEWGAPSRFTEWRDGQDQLFNDIVYCDKRHSLHAAPVGIGKTLSNFTAARAMGGRTAVLTATKPLQDQASGDFASIGVFDMRGHSNYTCKALKEGGYYEELWVKRWGRPTCDVGPCLSGLTCDLKEKGCDYFDAYRTAGGAEIVLTNYAYWISINKFGQGLGRFDRLILDECHLAESQLSSALSVEFNENDFKQLGSSPPKVTAPLTNWRMWARVLIMRLERRLEHYAGGAQIGAAGGPAAFVNDTDVPDAGELRYWKRMESKLKTLAEAEDDWVIEEEAGLVRIAPVWVKTYAERNLFCNIPRVIMTSATVRPKLAELLNLGDDYSFTEYPSTFPVHRRPIYWVPTVRLNHGSTDDDLKTMQVRVDQILQRRQHWKGIIHTVSYKRQEYLLANSRFRHVMYTHKTGNTNEVVKAFRKAQAPAVLVSPSVGTGYDFPFDAARFQIILKVPFKDPRGAVLRAQAKQDSRYLDYLTAQDLDQYYGRPNRDPKDFAETFILDDNIEWFLRRNKDFMSASFMGAFQRVDGVPDPPALEAIA